jgi:TM2 domain-containing membrane protein YozV
MSEQTEQVETAGTAIVEAPAGALPPPPGTPDAPEPEVETLYCPQCGVEMLSTDRYCGGCGWDAERPEDEPAPRKQARREPPPTPRRTAPPSDFNRLTTFLLCLLLGFFGVHRFYVGRAGSGVLWLLTGGLLAVGWIYDLVMIATGEFLDEQGKRIVYWQ